MMRHERIDPGAEAGWAEPSSDRVGDRMSRPALTIREDAAAREAWSVMRSRKIRHLPVLDGDGRLVGIVTDRDLRGLVFDASLRARLASAPAGEVTVGAVMTRGVVTTRVETPILDAARLMHERKIGALPVLEGERVVGIFTESDALAALVEVLGAAAIPRALRWAIATRRPA